MTPLFKAPGYDFEKAKKDYLEDQPMARFAHPDEIASGIFFTVSDEASFMTGSDWGRKSLPSLLPLFPSDDHVPASLGRPPD
jgi:hypothetical protein